MPRYVYRGGRGVRATTVLRLARPTERGCTCAPAFIVCISQGPGNRNHTFQPLSICSGSARFSRYASRTPSSEISGGRGVRAATAQGSEGRLEGVVPALLLFCRMTAGLGEQKSHISTPLDMFRSRPFFPICITHSSAKGFLRQGRSMTARTFRLPLTLFNTLNIFPRTGFGPLSPIIRSIGNSGGEPFPVRFFLYSLTRRNARLSSKRTGTSPTVTRRRIPPETSGTIRYIYRGRPFAGLSTPTNAPPLRDS